MNKSTSMSIILVAMMATSGFAMAQNSAANDNPSGTKGEATAPMPPKTGMGNARADVKANIGGGDVKARTQGEATAPHPMTGPGMANSRADVKAQIGGDLKSGTQGEATPGATTGSPSAASAERKAKRAERRAAAKAKRAAAAAEVKTQ